MSWAWAAVALLAVIGVGIVWPRIAAADDQPYADMSHSLGTAVSFPVRGRLVMEDPELDLAAATPLGESSQTEIVQREVHLRSGDLELGTVVSDDEGYLDASVPAAGLSPGHHVVQVFLDDAQIGKFRVRLLPMDHTGIVVRSDIDKTYLDTAFTRKRDIARLLVRPGPERGELPAMELVYRALRAGSGSDDRPIVFLSGSPRFFKRTLESKLLADEVQHDGVLLKPFKEIAARKAWDFAPRDIVPSLKEQIGYKLAWLLRVRLEVPPGTRELLMGDDSEADYVVYVLYHKLLHRQLTVEELDAELKELGVGQTWREQVRELGRSALEMVPAQSPVVGIYINVTGTAHGPHRAEDWTLDGWVRFHAGAWPLTLGLVQEGLIGDTVAAEVLARLEEKGVDAESRAAARGAAVKAGWLEDL